MNWDMRLFKYKIDDEVFLNSIPDYLTNFQKSKLNLIGTIKMINRKTYGNCPNEYYVEYLNNDGAWFNEKRLTKLLNR